MRPSLRSTQFLAAMLCLLCAEQTEAQSRAVSLPRFPAEGVVTVSGDSLDQLRLAALLGTASGEGLMLRSTSTLTDARRQGKSPRRFTIVLPQVTYVNNSGLPFGQNDGALWAGVGGNLRALAGFTISAGPIRLVAIPELVYSANKNLIINPVDPKFTYQPNLLLGRAHYSSPFNQFPYSIDMPWQFGAKSISKVYPGQSSLTVTAGPLEAGIATENEWWGPAVRNPIVMSDNAAGFPHAMIRTAHPVNTILGRFDGRWLVGSLQESPFFDNKPEDDVRSLSALALTWKRNDKSGLTLGFTRSVFTSVSGTGDVLGHFFDALKNVGHPDARSYSDKTMQPGSDQIMSLFARWALPVYGLESYVEWGRADFPVSFRDLIEQPDHSRGYTAGLQWVRSVGNDSRVRIQGEATNEEQSTTYRFRPIGSFYTSRSVIQGYTNYGQIIGSGIGPGSSSQWLATDYYKGPWQAGVTLGRTRFNNDALFLLQFDLGYVEHCAHDVTLYPGLRGGYANSFFRLRVDYAHANRYNTFFQNKVSCTIGGGGSDRVNRNFTVTLSTFAW
jgi:hypothetical protein